MSRSSVVCLHCGHKSLQWMGRCPSCGAWDSFAEEPKPSRSASASQPPLPISEIDLSLRPRIKSGIAELDRVTGGGIMAGATVLIAGEPGVGKSTLLLQAAAGYESSGLGVLLVCGEESLEQVALRAERIGGLQKVLLSKARDLDAVLEHCRDSDVAIVDSIQTLYDPGSNGEAGSPAQVRACAAALAAAARESGTALILIGHVTKDGAVAGPRVLEHLVDAVLTFEGDRGHSLRTIRAIKNRFGPTNEVGVFEMLESGLRQVEDASRLFLAHRGESVEGSMVGCVLEGRRPLALEIQALCSSSEATNLRRVASGIELSKVNVALAILDRRAGIRSSRSDVYVSIGGGFRTSDPGMDLPLMLSLAAALGRKDISSEIAAIGEVGLGGDIRPVSGMQSRINEIQRLGYKSVVSPYIEGGLKAGPEGIKVHAIKDLQSAISLVL